jgi:hypothetical protein
MTTSFQTIAAMQAATGLTDGECVRVISYFASAAPDGGGGAFVYRASSTATANAGIVFNATGMTVGRFLRIFDGPASLRWFGVKGDGTSCDSAALSQCFSTCAAMKLKILDAHGGEYKCTSPVKSGTSGILHLDLATHSRIFAAADMDALINLEPGLDAFILQGGILDSNGFMDSSASRGYLIAGISATGIPHFGLHSECPETVRIESTKFIGAIGTVCSDDTDPLKNGGHIHLQVSDDSRDMRRSVTIRDCSFASSSHLQTTSVVVLGTDDIIFGNVDISNNVFTNVYAASYVKNFMALQWNLNTCKEIKGNVLFTQNANVRRGKDHAVVWEPHDSLMITVQGNSIECYGEGITLGASCGPYKVCNNSIYGLDRERGDNVLVNDNTIRTGSGTPDGGNFRPYGTYANNTLKNAGRWGLRSNSSGILIADNSFIACKRGSIAIHGTNAFNTVIEGNIIDGAPIVIGGGGELGDGASDVHATLPILGNNTFLNIVGEELYVDNTSPSVCYARKPVSVKNWSSSSVSELYGMLGDVAMFDSSANAIAYRLPGTQKIGAGQKITLIHETGTNTVTISTENDAIPAGSVSTSNNWLLVAPQVNAWKSIKFETGKAIRIWANGGTLPSPLAEGRPYYLIMNVNPEENDRYFSLADTPANALAGTKIDLTSAGSRSPVYGDLLYNSAGVIVSSITLTFGKPAVFISGNGAWYQAA